MDVYWLEQQAGDVPTGNFWLSANESACLGRLHVPKRRADWRLGRWTAKCAVSACLGLPGDEAAMANIEVRPKPSGAPEAFFDGRPAGIAISLSHTQGTGLCAISAARAAVGCDLETVEARSPAFLADYFTHEERTAVAAASLALRDLLITVLWSAKESALKAVGCGLREDTRAVYAVPDGVEPADGEWRPLAVRRIGGAGFSGWWRCSGGIVRTVVAEPPPHLPIALPLLERSLAAGSALAARC